MPEGPAAAEAAHDIEEPSDERTTAEVDLDAYRDAVGEDLHETLDVTRWRSADDADAWVARIDAEIEDAVRQETGYASDLRKLIFPEIPRLKFAAPSAGVYVGSKEAIRKIHRGILLNGGVEACDGTRTAHDTLPLTIVRIGICLVSYNGHQDTWGQTLFRRDVPVRHGNPLEAVIELLDRRAELVNPGETGRLEN